MNQFDKASLLLSSFPTDKFAVNHDHPDWKIIGRNPDAPDTYSYKTPRERKTATRPHVYAPTKYPGIHSIEIDNQLRTIKITVTSKLLPDPREMLTLKTFHRVWEAVNATELLWVDAKAAQASAGLLLGDITTDGVMAMKAALYTKLLTRYYTGKQFKPTDYGPNTLWQSKAGSKRHTRSFTLYDKCLEAQDAAIYAPNTLRLELRLTSLEMLRKYLGLPDCKGHIPLQLALESETNAVALAFHEILAEVELSLVTEAVNAADVTPANRVLLFTSGLDIAQLALFLVLQHAGFNLSNIRAKLKADAEAKGKNGKNASRSLQPFKEVFTSWEAFTPHASQDVLLLKELIDKVNHVNSN